MLHHIKRVCLARKLHHIHRRLASILQAAPPVPFPRVQNQTLLPPPHGTSPAITDGRHVSTSIDVRSSAEPICHSKDIIMVLVVLLLIRAVAWHGQAQPTSGVVPHLHHLPGHGRHPQPERIRVSTACRVYEMVVIM